jgi:hypothetical protein
MRQAKTDWGELASHMCPVSCEQIHDAIPALVARIIAPLRILDDRAHSDLLLTPFACVS